MRILRCEARRVRGYWVAECLELSLSVKASSLERAKRALNAALAEHHLLSRRQAPRGVPSRARTVPFYLIRRVIWMLKWPLGLSWRVIQGSQR